MAQSNSPIAPPQVASTKKSRFAVPVKWKRRRLLITVGLLALVVLTALLGIFHFATQTTPLRIALVATLTGPNAWMGQESFQAVKLLVDQVNQDGGVNGHQIELLPYDDKFGAKTDNQANGATDVAHKVVGGDALMVLGPIYSQAAMVSNPIYKDHQIPLLSGTISFDRWTQENPYAFRLRTDSSSQGLMFATYARQILGLSTATVVNANDEDYGRPTKTAFRAPFVQQGGNISDQTLEFDPQNYKQSDLDKIALDIRNHKPDSQIIYIAALEGPTVGVVKALRQAGIKTPIFCTTACGTSHFVDSFAPEQKSWTEGIYAPAPVIFDSAPDEAQAFASKYQRTYGNAPSWPGAMFYETAQVAITALRAAKDVQGTHESVKNDREEIFKKLQEINSTQKSVEEAINGPVYFDRNRNAVLPLRFGVFLQGRLHSLPTQLIEVNNPDSVDPNLEKAGEIIQVEDLTLHKHVLLKQHVAYTGIDLNKVTNVNLSSSTFNADFYFWVLFNGSEDATAITFTNASDVAFDPKTPLKQETLRDLKFGDLDFGDLNYRLYHVTGTWKANYDLHEYPFDQQQLTIGFQNTKLMSDRLIYVIDELGLRLRPDNTPEDPTAEAAVFQSLSSWVYVSAQYASDTFTSHSTLGDPRNFGQHTQTAYSGLQVTATLQRRSLSYLISHLLPQILLFLLAYASLFLHIKHLGDRLTLIVTSLLASAVLLLSLNGELPEIGYVVSLYYIYYIFFGLCLVCIGITLFMEWLQHNGKHQKIVERINFSLHIIYLTTVTLTIIYYLVTYGSRLA